MKEIIAIIRPKMVSRTRTALEKLGVASFTVLPVMGRGKQRGLMGEVDIEYRPQVVAQSHRRVMKYIPKRYVNIVVPDRIADAVVATIVQVNRTGEFGDGKVFVCPVEESLRVRTGEVGDDALL